MQYPSEIDLTLAAIETYYTKVHHVPDTVNTGLKFDVSKAAIFAGNEINNSFELQWTSVIVLLNEFFQTISVVDKDVNLRLEKGVRLQHKNTYSVMFAFYTKQLEI